MIAKGDLTGSGLHIGIVRSRYNAGITEGLFRGAMRALIASEVSEENITSIEVPGAFEIPFALTLLAQTKDYDALIALGCVIKGETAHFEYIADAAIGGIITTSEKFGIPISCGVLTAYTEAQALERSADNEENKGSEAALTAIEMANLRKRWKD